MCSRRILPTRIYPFFKVVVHGELDGVRGDRDHERRGIRYVEGGYSLFHEDRTRAGEHRPEFRLVNLHTLLDDWTIR